MYVLKPSSSQASSNSLLATSPYQNWWPASWIVTDSGLRRGGGGPPPPAPPLDKAAARGPGEVVDVLLNEAVGLGPIRVGGLLLEAPRRADHEVAGHGQPNVVDTEVGEELRPRIEGVAIPLPFPVDADLGEPLHDEVVVVDPARAAHVALGDEGVPFDGEAGVFTRRDRLCGAHLHHRAVLHVAVLVKVAERGREVFLGRAEETDRADLGPAPAPVRPPPVPGLAATLSTGAGREGVAEGGPVEMEREGREGPVGRVPALGHEGA